MMGQGWKLVFICCGLLSTVLAFDKDYVEEVKQNFAEKTNSELINMMAAFQRASLVYMAYASYFDRSSVSLPGFRQFFLKSSEAALKDSQRVVDYINVRGGHQQFPLLDMKVACRSMDMPDDLLKEFPNYKPQICPFILRTDPSASLKKKKPSKEQPQSNDEDWQHGLMSLVDSLLLEKSLNGQLLDLSKAAHLRKDRHLSHTVDHHFLQQKTEQVKKLADLITRLKAYGDQDYPLGEYLLDLELNG